MTVEAALYSLLKNNAGVAAKVGDRIYPNILPQNIQYPCLSFRNVSTQSDQTMSGISGFAQGRFQIDVWSNNHLEACQIREVVRLALQAYRGTVDGVVLQEVQYENATTLYEPELRVHHIAMDFLIGYTEAKS